LIDVILIWSFPDGPPAFVQALNVIVWASFAVVYVARLVWPVGKAMFVRTPSGPAHGPVADAAVPAHLPAPASQLHL
jgi:hypothetical protein